MNLYQSNCPVSGVLFLGLMHCVARKKAQKSLTLAKFWLNHCLTLSIGEMETVIKPNENSILPLEISFWSVKGLGNYLVFRLVSPNPTKR